MKTAMFFEDILISNLVESREDMSKKHQIKGLLEIFNGVKKSKDFLDWIREIK
jgi:hypothetical protein